jgi:ribosomal protein S13
MENYKETVDKIWAIAEFAPELNMGNYTEEQVEKLNDAMLQIHDLCYYLKKREQNSIETAKNAPLVDVSKSEVRVLDTVCSLCKKPIKVKTESNIFCDECWKII